MQFRTVQIIDLAQLPAAAHLIRVRARRLHFATELKRDAACAVERDATNRDRGVADSGAFRRLTLELLTDTVRFQFETFVAFINYSTS